MQLLQLFTVCRQNKDQTAHKQNIVNSKTILFTAHAQFIVQEQWSVGEFMHGV